MGEKKRRWKIFSVGRKRTNNQEKIMRSPAVRRARVLELSPTGKKRTFCGRKSVLVSVTRPKRRQRVFGGECHAVHETNTERGIERWETEKGHKNLEQEKMPRQGKTGETSTQANPTTKGNAHPAPCTTKSTQGLKSAKRRKAHCPLAKGGELGHCLFPTKPDRRSKKNIPRRGAAEEPAGGEAKEPLKGDEQSDERFD